CNSSVLSHQFLTRCSAPFRAERRCASSAAPVILYASSARLAQHENSLADRARYLWDRTLVEEAMSMPGTLAGLRIIEIAGVGPGPFAAMMLADHGAEVIRIERVGVDPDQGL